MLVGNPIGQVTPDQGQYSGRRPLCRSCGRLAPLLLDLAEPLVDAGIQGCTAHEGVGGGPRRSPLILTSRRLKFGRLQKNLAGTFEERAILGEIVGANREEAGDHAAGIAVAVPPRPEVNAPADEHPHIVKLWLVSEEPERERKGEFSDEVGRAGHSASLTRRTISRASANRYWAPGSTSRRRRGTCSRRASGTIIHVGSWAGCSLRCRASEVTEL